MSLVCAGINHHTAPVTLRERLSLGPDGQRRLLRSLSEPRRGAGSAFAEFAILSTCNRTEVYAAAIERSASALDLSPDLAALFSDLAELPHETLAPHLYHHAGSGVVRHLCRVAAGLDSMVLGESEILGQVTGAHELAADEGTSGPFLTAAFQTAARAGRRARAETGICRHPASVSTEAVRVLAELVGSLERQSVLIVGTGKMGRLAGEALRAHGIRQITVVSRTSQHAEALAGEWGAAALAWHDLPLAIRAADAVLCSTAAPHAVITRELVERAIGPGGDGRRRVFIDIAVPRDVEPEVAGLPGVAIHDLDALQQRLEGNLELRRREIPAVERIVEEELSHFEEWRRGAALRPLLGEMRAHTESIRRRELDRMLRRLGGDAPPALRAQFDAFSQSLVNKLLHEPTRRLREVQDPDQARTFTAVTRALFGLESDQPQTTGTAA